MKAEVSIESIPTSVDDEITANLMNYFVPLSTVRRPRNSEPILTFIGSGTLVEIHSQYYILTAAHIWHEVEKEEELCLAVTTRYPSAFVIPRKAISAKQLWGTENPEWGPDLALLELPRACVSIIATYKSFLNLALHKSMFDSHPPAEKAFWAVTRLVGQFSGVEQGSDTVEGDAQTRTFLGPVCHMHSRGGFDYFEPSAKLGLAGVPASFGGVSGGGLWEIGLSMKDSGTVYFDGRRYFRGVAFWQTAPSDGRRAIRCHGPRSIFEMAWESWDLPKE